ncbi:MAG: dehydrogenase, partial [Chloroflexota bacterium]|nr:dehydrogenase [Chloroflexota bacterium]
VDRRQQIAREAGLRRVLPAVPLDDPEFAGQVDLVLECSGHEAAALDGCRMVRKRGEVVQVGTPWVRQTDLHAHDLLHAVFHRYAVLRSGWEWELPLHPEDFRRNSLYGNLRAALEWLADGRITVAGLYATLPPERCQDAYQDLLHKRGDRLATVLEWTAPG